MTDLFLREGWQAATDVGDGNKMEPKNRSGHSNESLKTLPHEKVTNFSTAPYFWDFRMLVAFEIWADLFFGSGVVYVKLQ